MTLHEMKDFVFKHHKTMTLRELCEVTRRDKGNMFKFLQNHNLEPKLTRKKPGQKVKLVRPEPVYTNISSPYGIADELKTIKIITL